MSVLKNYDVLFAISEGRRYTIQAENMKQAEVLAEHLHDYGELPEPNETFETDSFLVECEDQNKGLGCNLKGDETRCEDCAYYPDYIWNEQLQTCIVNPE